MDKLFSEIISIDGVIGLILLNNDKSVEYKAFSDFGVQYDKDFDNFLQSSVDFEVLKKVFDCSTETMLIYEDLRLYIKKVLNNYLIIAMKLFVPMSLIRLNCQILEPKLDSKINVKKFKFFSKS